MSGAPMDELTFKDWVTEPQKDGIPGDVWLAVVGTPSEQYATVANEHLWKS